MDRPSADTRSSDESPSPPFNESLNYITRVTPFLSPDDLSTPTSDAQAETFELCAAYLTGKEREISGNLLNTHGLPGLQRAKHVKFLKASLERYPEAYQRQDASRPWIVYWCITALGMLGADVSAYRQRAIDTFTPLQNHTGGFGGGHGQLSHCAATYAAVLTLAQVDALHIIDKASMRIWLASIKQPSGAFSMVQNGETDVRGAYCALTVCALLGLDLTLPPESPALELGGHQTLVSGLAAWIGRCQTFEGGIGGAPGNEAHGAYVFCALACLCILAPPREVGLVLDLPALVRWLAGRAMEEGGFAGRTNKLVDACYSQWIGGCWNLVEAALASEHGEQGSAGLWDREALVRYTLACSQTKQGGLRDKPGTRQDAYHTCYSLAGLSAAQNTWTFTARDSAEIKGVEGLSIRSEPPETTKSAKWTLDSAFGWTGRLPSAEEEKMRAFDPEDRVAPVHPVFVIAPEAVERARLRFSRTEKRV